MDTNHKPYVSHQLTRRTPLTLDCAGAQAERSVKCDSEAFDTRTTVIVYQVRPGPENGARLTWAQYYSRTESYSRTRWTKPVHHTRKPTSPQSKAMMKHVCTCRAATHVPSSIHPP